MTRDIDWGIPVPLEGWSEQPTKRLYVWFDAVIGYLSASIEWARRQGDPERVARVVERPRRPRPTTSWARTTSSSTRQIWPAELLAYDGRGDAWRGARRVRRPRAAHRGGLQRVHDDGEQAVLDQPRPRDPRRRHALALPARRAALLHLRRRARDVRLRLHLGRVRPAHQLRARRRLGQPGQPHRHDDRQELRRDPGRRAARGRRRGRARRGAHRLRHRGRPARTPPAARRGGRGDAGAWAR